KKGARGGGADVNIGSDAFTPRPDYPIQPKPYFDVRLTDAFWKPKVETNARVTIPIEIKKLTEGGRVLTGNVLEAAMLSNRTHPDPAVASVIETSVRALAARPPR